MNRQTKLFIVVIVIIVAVTGIISLKSSEGRGKVEYLECLNEVICTVDGKEYLLKDLAVYIAYQENSVEEQAIIYNPENTGSYWNVHANGEFIKLSAKEHAISTAIHDIILYELAVNEGLELDQEEKKYLEGKKTDFWEDLEEEQREKIGVSQEEINQALDRMALAQKGQEFIAGSHGVDYEEYNVDRDMYQELLEEHTYSVNENLWRRVDFGNITLEH